MARDADDVAKVFAYGRRTGIPVTLRAGGTSLNGQGQGDGILVDVRRHWRGVSVEEGGARARVRPGRCSATPTGCWPPTAASSDPTRPAPTSPASAA